jgi:hypothetical protein
MGMGDHGAAGIDRFVSIYLPGHNTFFFSLFNNNRVIQFALHQSHFYISVSYPYKRKEDAGGHYALGYFL